MRFPGRGGPDSARRWRGQPAVPPRKGIGEQMPGSPADSTQAPPAVAGVGAGCSGGPPPPHLPGAPQGESPPQLPELEAHDRRESRPKVPPPPV